VRPQFVEDAAAAEPGSFDVVCSYQVLEHVVDAAAFIRSCAALVRDGGLLLLSTPNNEFALNRAMGDAFDLPPHHMNHFTPGTFRNIADHLGLELVDVRAQTTRVFRRARPGRGTGALVPRVLRRSAGLALRLLSGTRMAPGHTILAVYRVRC
jgi:SAM-dependent methyltransferase